MTKRRSKSLLLYQWHRWVGLFAALSALAFSATGIVLNHTDELTLADRHVDSAWLRRWYHYQPSRLETAFRAGDNWLFVIDGKLYWNAEALPLDQTDLRGAVRFGDETAVAFPDKLILLDDQGRISEALDAADGIPQGVQRLGKSVDGRLLLDAGDGQQISDWTLFYWQPDQSSVAWDSADQPDAAALAAAMQSSERRKLNLETLLLDLHSGRFFGKAGVWLADLAALALMFLGISGVLIWLIRLVKQRQHQKRQSRIGERGTARG